MANNSFLINRKHVRHYARLRVQELRPEWGADRVSRQFLDDLNTLLRLMIDKSIRKHPTIGRTVTALYR
ncbi:MAG: hypothetical protein AMJ84_02975 [Acidithiobacillales bacterium SM23_46]|nr:MAG: hypothetical protein AMJ84_02975 [Acidithiobacillales bacterium SM23_46]KPL27885.1 MAG: hypothetical protein AMJ72_06340 [Acidithiobacillales bacterium SM1_46]